MKLPSFRSFVLALIAAALPGTVAAQTPAVIDHLPYTISARGLYVLTSDLSSNVSNAQNGGNLITVAASNVTIDFQGHFISGPVDDAMQGNNGIYAQERNNITVKNGTIANVRNGIVFTASSGTANNLNHELDHLRVTRCLSFGIALNYAASCSVTNCKLSFIGSNSGGGIAAINITGPGVTVQNCLISQGNDLFSTAIRSDAGSFSRQNTISNYRFGVAGGTYQDNLTYGCSTPFSGGTDAGGNN